MIYCPLEYKNDYEMSQIQSINRLIKNLNSREQNILKTNALSPIAYLLVSELNKTEKNIALIQESLQYLLTNKLVTDHLAIQNNKLYMPPTDTRGEELLYNSTNEPEMSEFYENVDKAKSLLGEDWEELISIIKSVTFVSITGKEELLKHFSGSSSEIWGAMHMNKNFELFNIIECLTHEASHHWLNLFEFNSEDELIINGWTKHEFISPWRRDLRPLMGILHGVFVFGNVFTIYHRIHNLLPDYYTDRMYYVASQTFRGYEILEINNKLIKKSTQTLIQKAKNDFLVSYEKLNNKKKMEFYNSVIKQEADKIQARKEFSIN